MSFSISLKKNCEGLWQAYSPDLPNMSISSANKTHAYRLLKKILVKWRERSGA